MADQRRLALGILALAGVLISHAVGYWIAELDTADRAQTVVDHGYLAVVPWFLGPAALVAIGWLAVKSARAAGPGADLRWTHLAGLQLVLLAVQETGERVVAGEGAMAVLGEPAVAWSLGCSLLVAALLTWLVRSAAKAVARWARAAAPRPDRPAFPSITGTQVILLLLPAPTLVRGPPLRSV